MEKSREYLKGRGAQLNTDNPYLKNSYDTHAEEGLDEAWEPDPETIIMQDFPKTIVNKVNSPDIPLPFSINPYQGCEHGCTYCYARNAHQYWGLSAGLDFERKIIAKMNAPELLRKQFLHPKWKAAPIMFSGNTDCYQPVERKLELTRQCLEVFREFHHPVSLITKNSLILRDLDILEDLAKENLVHVAITITTLNPELKRFMEPRTSAPHKRIETIHKLSEKGIPVNLMNAPLIPGLNIHEIHDILKAAAEAGAVSAGFTMVRLNGAVATIFEDWLRKSYPDKAEKVLNQIRACHDGQLNDNRFGKRMTGSGTLAASIREMFHIAKKKYFPEAQRIPYNLEAFRRPGDNQLSLF